ITVRPERTGNATCASSYYRVIARSVATRQSPSEESPAEGDCRVATLLAMTRECSSLLPFLCRWLEAFVGVADADQYAAEPHEREGAEDAGQLGHVAEEDLGGDDADPGECGAAEPFVAAVEADPEGHGGEGEPGGGIGVPLALAALAPDQVLAAEGVADFEAQP